jgi:hypothetical protein
VAFVQAAFVHVVFGHVAFGHVVSDHVVSRLVNQEALVREAPAFDLGSLVQVLVFHGTLLVHLKNSHLKYEHSNVEVN